MAIRLTVDPIGCAGHGLCAELLPELIVLDDWGYPILLERDVPPHLVGAAKRAATLCPKVALALRTAESWRPAPSGRSAGTR
jgi:ferredoxin